MSHHHLQSVMTGEWDSVEISEGEVDSIDQVTVITTGLSSEPSLLHAEHLGNLSHLSEVQELHSRFLVSAGELPETHLAEVLPERRLEWMVEELGGVLREREFTIPLRGTTLGRVEVSKGELHGHPAIKLALFDIDWEQVVTLPEGAGEISAIWDSGHLQIGW